MAIKLVQKFDSTEDDSSVIPFDDAMRNYAMFGNGVFSAGLSGLKLTVNANGYLHISTGYGCALGYIFKNTAGAQIEIPAGERGYSVGVNLTVVDEETVADSYSAAMLKYKEAVAAATSADEIEQALTTYTNTISSLSNNSIVFAVNGSVMYEPNIISGNILVNGYGTTFVPLWVVLDGTVVTINSIEPGIAKDTRNLLSGGYVGGKSFGDIFNDFSTSSYPGAKNADIAVKALKTERLGTSTGAVAMEDNLKVKNSGYLPIVYCLCKDKSMVLTKTTVRQNITFDYAFPTSDFSPLKLMIFGSGGNLLCELSMASYTIGSSWFYIDSDYGNDGVIKAYVNANSISYELSSDLPTSKLFYNEYSSISVYVVGTRVSL